MRSLIRTQRIVQKPASILLKSACSCNQFKSVLQNQLQSVLLSLLPCTDFSTHSVTRATTNALTSNYHYPYRSSYPLYNSLDTCRFLHTSTPVYGDPSKPSSKIEESVQALKEKAKELEQPAESETKVAVKKSLKQKIVDKLVHYFHGFRLLFIVINLSAKLVLRILRGKQLSRREHNLEDREELLRKLTVLFFICGRIELYELALSHFKGNPGKVRITPPISLDHLSTAPKDENMRYSYKLHFNKWIRILQESTDPRRPAIIVEIYNLGFPNVETCACHIALLYVLTSNAIHGPSPMIMDFQNEDTVINAVRARNICDILALKACQLLYRLPKLE